MVRVEEKTICPANFKQHKWATHWWGISELVEGDPYLAILEERRLSKTVTTKSKQSSDSGEKASKKAVKTKEIRGYFSKHAWGMWTKQLVLLSQGIYFYT